MDKMEIQEKIIDILTKHTSIDRASFTPEKNLKLDLGLDAPKLRAGQLYFLSPTFLH